MRTEAAVGCCCACISVHIQSERLLNITGSSNSTIAEGLQTLCRNVLCCTFVCICCAVYESTAFSFYTVCGFVRVCICSSVHAWLLTHRRSHTHKVQDIYIHIRSHIHATMCSYTHASRSSPSVASNAPRTTYSSKTSKATS